MTAAAKIRLRSRHPVTGRKPSYRDWWFEHDGVVFHISTDWLRSTIWTIHPDTDHLPGSRELVEFVQSSAYWCGISNGLADARAKLAEFITSDHFPPLRDAYRALPQQ